MKRGFSFWEGSRIYEIDNSKIVQSLLKENQLPDNVFIFILNSNLSVEKKLKRISNSIIYQKKGKK